MRFLALALMVCVATASSNSQPPPPTAAVPAAGDSDLQIVQRRLYAEANPLSACSASGCASATKLSDSMGVNGSWSDINYSDQSRTVWAPTEHWDRLTVMARALHCAACGASAKKSLQPKIALGVAFWKRKDFIDPNWWFNDFGVPMKVDSFLVIMANASSGGGTASLLPKALEDYCLELLARGADPMWEPPPRPRGGGYTGENLVWSLQIDIQRGVLAGNRSLVAGAFMRMWDSLVIEPQHGDGLMADGSFHQHGALLQSGSYGSAMMVDILSFVQLSAGTAFAMPAAPLAVFVHYLTAGQQYMLRAGKGARAGANFLIPPRGRELSRMVGAGKGTFPAAEVIAGIPALVDLLPATSAAATALISFQHVLNGERSPITATVSFPESDYTVHHRPGFSQDVRTWSTRTESAECVNKENLLGEHLANGVSYTMIDGDEYRDIFPVWDWRKVPGALARQGKNVRPVCGYESLGSTEFVGAVEAHTSSIGGVVAMDFAYGPRPKRQAQIASGHNMSQQQHSLMRAATVKDTEARGPDPTCKHGLRGGADICCPTSCHVCGGKTCSTPPNVGKNCCVTAIAKNDRYCAQVGPPCIMGSEPAPPDPAEILTAKRAWFLLEEGFLSLTGAVSLSSADPSVAVTLEQSLLKGDVAIVMSGDGGSTGSTRILPNGTNISFGLTETTDQATMLTHHGITYAALSLKPPTAFTSAAEDGGWTPPAPRLRVTVGPQRGSWHLINQEMSNHSITKDVFQLGIDLGPAPLSNASAAFGVFPGSTPGQVATVLEQLTVVANTEQRQVVARLSPGSQQQHTMAVVYSGETVFTKAEMGYDLTTNSSLILVISGQQQRQDSGQNHQASGGSNISVAFSRPVGGAGTVRLVVSSATEGWAAARELRTMVAAIDTATSARGEGGGVVCHTDSTGRHIIDLQLPVAPGQTAQGSCMTVGW